MVDEEAFVELVREAVAHNRSQRPPRVNAQMPVPGRSTQHVSVGHRRVVG